MRLVLVICGLVVCWSASELAGQSSSLMRVPVQVPQTGQVQAVGQPGTTVAGAAGAANLTTSGSRFAAMPPRDDTRATTRAIESVSLVAVPRIPPRKFKVHDLITIIVRQHKKYEAEAELETKKKWDIEGKLSEWFRFHPRNRLGADQLSAGDPGFNFAFNNKYKTEGENEREDKFITRIQATIIDVKQNGNLQLEARQREKHDEEEFVITLKGECRSDDVTPDNTVLSTQIALLELEEVNTGAVRDAARRGWIPRVLDWARPF